MSLSVCVMSLRRFSVWLRLHNNISHEKTVPCIYHCLCRCFKFSYILQQNNQKCGYVHLSRCCTKTWSLALSLISACFGQRRFLKLLPAVCANRYIFLLFLAIKWRSWRMFSLHKKFNTSSKKQSPGISFDSSILEIIIGIWKFGLHTYSMMLNCLVDTFAQLQIQSQYWYILLTCTG